MSDWARFGEVANQVPSAPDQVVGRLRRREVAWDAGHGGMPRGVPRVIRQGCGVINEGSGGSGRSGFSVGGRMLNAMEYGIGPSAAYTWRAARRTARRAGWWAAWRRGRGGGGTGDAVSYLVHRSRAARPKLLQHRGCHKAAVMTEFTATRPPLHILAQAVEDARGVWRRRCAARLARAASGQEPFES